MFLRGVFTHLLNLLHTRCRTNTRRIRNTDRLTKHHIWYQSHPVIIIGSAMDVNGCRQNESLIHPVIITVSAMDVNGCRQNESLIHPVIITVSAMDVNGCRQNESLIHPVIITFSAMDVNGCRQNESLIYPVIITVSAIDVNGCRQNESLIHPVIITVAAMDVNGCRQNESLIHPVIITVAAMDVNGCRQNESLIHPVIITFSAMDVNGCRQNESLIHPVIITVAAMDVNGCRQNESDTSSYHHCLSNGCEWVPSEWESDTSSYHHCLSNGCEWVPSEWESVKTITIIHSTPVHQLTSGEDKSWNKSSIKMILIHNNSSSSEKCSGLNQERNLHRSSSIYKTKQLLTLIILSSPDVNWWTEVLWIIVMFLSDSHSDGTHSHPLLRHWCRDTFLQTWWRNKLILISDELRMNTFLFFGWTFPLMQDVLV